MKKLVLIAASLLLVFSTCAVVLAQGYDEMPADAKIVELGVEGEGYENLEPGVRGGTFYMSTFGSGPKKWNDVTAHETTTTRYTNQMFRGLMSSHPVSGAVVPELAKSYEISEDGLTITFHLRKVNWSDGMPFTADDVLFTYNDLIYNEDVETDSRDGLELPDGTYPVFEKVDDNTIEVKLSMIFRPIFKQLTVNIMPKHKQGLLD